PSCYKPQSYPEPFGTSENSCPSRLRITPPQQPKPPSVTPLKFKAYLPDLNKVAAVLEVSTTPVITTPVMKMRHKVTSGRNGNGYEKWLPTLESASRDVFRMMLGTELGRGSPEPWQGAEFTAMVGIAG